MKRLRLLAFAATVALAGLACAGTSLDSELGQRYGLTVLNEMPHAMIVSVDAGSGTRLLGTVGAQREERFVLYDASAGTVTIVARDEGDSHTVRRTVTLRAGESVTVRLN
jgi:hypothetical protein